MSPPFPRARPLQAGKLVAAAGALLIAAVAFFDLAPVGGITTLFLAPVVALALTVVVVAEALLAGYRALDDGRRPTERLADRPLYAVVRVLEVGLAVAAVAGFVGIVAWIPAGPMAGPGAVWVFFVVVGLAGLVLAGTLVRTLVEYVDYRRTGAA